MFRKFNVPVLLVLMAVGLLASASASAGTSSARTDVPAGFSSRFGEAPGRSSYPSPGRIARYQFAARPNGSMGATMVRFTIVKRDRYMRLLRHCSSGFRLVRGKPSWIMRFPARRAQEKRVNLCFRISSRAPMGRTLWLTTDTVGTRGQHRLEELGVRKSAGPVQR